MTSSKSSFHKNIIYWPSDADIKLFISNNALKIKIMAMNKIKTITKIKMMQKNKIKDQDQAKQVIW